MAKQTQTEDTTPTPMVRRRDLLSTGSTLLNLAFSDNPFGGLLKGHYYFVVGDSESGKTFLCLTCFAEAARNRQFDNYQLIFDQPEHGALMNMDAMFGEAAADRIRPPAEAPDGRPLYSDSLEAFYYNLDEATKRGPCVYVLDSMDVLIPKADEKKYEEHKAAYMRHRDEETGGKVEKKKKGEEEAKDPAGSYGTAKAKLNSEFLRKSMKRLKDTGSILIIISQTRANIGGYGKTRSGGRALRFYATVEMWSSIEERLTRTVHGKHHEIGVRVELDVQKNRITGKRAAVLVDIYPSYGMDDVGSMVDWLVEEEWWPVTKETITAKGLGLSASRAKLIALIEEKGLQRDVQAQCGRCWDELQAALALHRRPRYEEE